MLIALLEDHSAQAASEGSHRVFDRFLRAKGDKDSRVAIDPSTGDLADSCGEALGMMMVKMMT
jgi:hypothetical protein